MQSSLLIEVFSGVITALRHAVLTSLGVGAHGEMKIFQGNMKQQLFRAKATVEPEKHQSDQDTLLSSKIQVPE